MSTPVTYILISFGDNINFHTQANFCFLTLKKFADKNAKFVVYTDTPKYYKWVSSFVEIRTISSSLIKEWIGKYDYFYRVKLKVLLDSCERDEGHLIYLDSDTIAIENLDSMVEKLDAGHSLMHLKENLLSEDTATDKQDMWTRTKNNHYSGIVVNEKTSMWNSGLIAIPAKDKKDLLNKALAINDQLCEEKVECRVKEQFAIGIVLDSTGKLLHGTRWVIHYWGNKEEWNQTIALYFSAIHQQALTASEAVDKLDIVEWVNVPINRMKTSLGKRLIKWSHKYFPDKTILGESLRDK